MLPDDPAARLRRRCGSKWNVSSGRASGSSLGRAYADTDNNVTTPQEMVTLLEMLVINGRLSATGARAGPRLHASPADQRSPAVSPAARYRNGAQDSTIAGVRNDAGILFVRRGPVLVCAFTRDLKEDLAGTQAIAEVGRLVHAAFVS